MVKIMDQNHGIVILNVRNIWVCLLPLIDKNIWYFVDSSYLIKDVKNILKNAYQVNNLLEKECRWIKVETLFMCIMNIIFFV